MMTPRPDRMLRNTAQRVERTGNGRPSMRCMVCGAYEVIRMPLSISAFCARVNAFAKAHTDCVAQEDKTQ